MAAYASPTNTAVGSYPKAITVANVSGLPGSAASADTVTRQADMSLWDSTQSVFVSPEQTTVGLNQ
jgi:hypothetical protein